MRQVWSFTGVIFFALLFSFQPTTSLVISLPPNIADYMEEATIFEDFYAENPDVYITFVSQSDAIDYESLIDDPQTYLAYMEQFAASGDVVYIPSGFSHSFNLAATRAGYFYDLAPLTAADPTLNAETYYPAALSAFQWEGGWWALPVGIRPSAFLYEPATFEEVGLTPPDATWTADDFFNAVDVLNTAGYSVGLPYGNSRDFIRMSYRQPLHVEGVPAFTADGYIALAERYAEAEARDTAVFDETGMPTVLDIGDPSFAAIPNEPPLAAVPLPVSDITVGGLAISSGTANPELAYRIARYLMDEPEFTRHIGEPRLANRVLDTERQARYTAADNQAALDAILEQPFNPLDVQFAWFAYAAIDEPEAYGETARAAVEAVQAQTAAALEMAAARQGMYTLALPVVQPPEPLAPGEIEIDFTPSSFSFGREYETALTQALNDFAELDPVVGRVNLTTNIRQVEETDCLMSPPWLIQRSDVLPVQPLNALTETDPAFNADDYVAGSLNQVTVNGQLVGLPFTLTPASMRYVADRFTELDIPLPTNGWTTDEFEAALQTLARDSDVPLANPNAADLMPYLMLAASYGGVPVDFNAPEGISFDLTSPESQAALQQVLDMVRADYIAYYSEAGSNQNEGMNFPAMIFSSAYGNVEGADLQSAVYPTNGTYIPVSYLLEAFFVSTESQNPEACYRLYQYLMNERLDLLRAMPARTSLVNNEALISGVGSSLAETYRAFADQLAQPNAVVFPLDFVNRVHNSASRVQRMWLTEVFDAYLFADADLPTVLTTAQTRLDAFAACLAERAPTVPPVEEPEAYNAYETELRGCATEIDPNTASLWEGRN